MHPSSRRIARLGSETPCSIFTRVKNDEKLYKYLHAMESRSTPRWRNYLQGMYNTGTRAQELKLIKITRDYASLEKVRHNNTVKNMTSSLKILEKDLIE